VEVVDPASTGVRVTSVSVVVVVVEARRPRSGWSDSGVSQAEKMKANAAKMRADEYFIIGHGYIDNMDASLEIMRLRHKEG